MPERTLVERLRALIEQLSDPDDDTDRSDVCVDLLRWAADELERLASVEAMPAPLEPGAVRLWLRREPEGHFTLLLEGPGTPRRGLGFVDHAGATESSGPSTFDTDDVIDRKSAVLADAVVTAWEKA